MFGSSFRNATSLDLKHEVIDGVVVIHWKITTLPKFSPKLIGVKLGSDVDDSVRGAVKALNTTDPTEKKEISEAIISEVILTAFDPRRLSSEERPFLETTKLSGEISDPDVEPGTTVSYSFHLEEKASKLYSTLALGIDDKYYTWPYRIDVAIPGEPREKTASGRKAEPRETVASVQAEKEVF